jgi:hypothetical protein
MEWQMTVGNLFVRTGRGLAIGAAVLTAVGLMAVPRPAHAVGPGEAAGIGLGAFAAGTALGAAANPYYNPYYNPYGYYYPSAPAYYPSAPAYYPATPYYPPRSCWDPYYRRYYAC